MTLIVSVAQGNSTKPACMNALPTRYRIPAPMPPPAEARKSNFMRNSRRPNELQL